MSDAFQNSPSLQAARDAEARGDNALAADLYEKLAANFDGDKLELIEISGRLIALERIDSALHLLTKGSERFPNSHAIRARLARAFTVKGDFAGAAKEYRKQVHHDPKRPKSWLTLARMTWHAGNYAEAAEAIKRAVALSPDDIEILTAYGEIMDAFRQFDEAETAYRRVMANDPNELSSYIRLSRLLMMKDQLDEAEALLRHAISKSEDLAPAHFNLASILLKRHRFIDALASVDKGLALDPSHADGHTVRAMILMEMNQPQLALISFSESLRLVPDVPVVLFGMANALGRGGSHPEAVKVLDRVLAIEPGNVQARHFRAAWSGEIADDQSSEYARTLFDGAARYFDQHLVNALEYSAPKDTAEILSGIVRRADGFKALCDVGCGTGLVAQALAAVYTIPRKVGIDVSPKMIAVAESKKLYDELIVGDAVLTLNALHEQFDLITAIDMLIYVGALEKIFAALAARLSPGGMLAFSIEHGDVSDGFRLSSSGRFLHATPYLARVIDGCGLKRKSTTDATLRIEAEKPQDGQIWIVQRPA